MFQEKYLSRAHVLFSQKTECVCMLIRAPGHTATLGPSRHEHMFRPLDIGLLCNNNFHCVKRLTDSDWEVISCILREIKILSDI